MKSKSSGQSVVNFSKKKTVSSKSIIRMITNSRNTGILKSSVSLNKNSSSYYFHVKLRHYPGMANLDIVRRQFRMTLTCPMLKLMQRMRQRRARRLISKSMSACSSPVFIGLKIYKYNWTFDI